MTATKTINVGCKNC